MLRPVLYCIYCRMSSAARPQDSLWLPLGTTLPHTRPIAQDAAFLQQVPGSEPPNLDMLGDSFDNYEQANSGESGALDFMGGEANEGLEGNNDAYAEEFQRGFEGVEE